MQQDFSSEYATWLLVSFIFHDTFPVRHGVMLRFCVWKVWWLWIRKRFIAFGHPRLSPGGSNLCMEINNSYVFYNWLWIKFTFMTEIHKIHEKSTQNWTHFDESNSQKSMWIIYEFVWILPECCESHMASINWDAMMYFGSFHAELTLTSASTFEIDTHPLQIMTTWLAIGLLSTIISVGLAIISLHKAFIRNYSNGI